jgi:hypothetical protein
VALLVLPAPQNLLMQKMALDKLPANAAPLDSLLLVARHLGEFFYLSETDDGIVILSVPSAESICLTI